MLLGRSWREPGIWVTQVGNPLAHGREDTLKRVRSDRLVALAGSSVPPQEDQEVGDFVLKVGKVMEGRGLPVLLAEGSPDAEDFVS